MFSCLFQDEVMGDGEYHGVDLTRGTRGFGFSIRGGREFQNMPLFVLQIAENGPASIDNRLRVMEFFIKMAHNFKLQKFSEKMIIFFSFSGGRPNNRNKRHKYQKYDPHRSH